MSVPGPASPPLRVFVRETLGCNCPDAVFDVVERSEEVAPVSRVPFTRWVIGGRLLVYLVRPPSAGAEIVRELAALGRQDRDRLRLNRFRLALAWRPGEVDAHAAERAFAAVVGDDPKAHLHRVAAAGCQGGLLDG